MHKVSDLIGKGNTLMINPEMNIYSKLVAFVWISQIETISVTRVTLLQSSKRYKISIFNKHCSFELSNNPKKMPFPHKLLRSHTQNICFLHLCFCLSPQSYLSRKWTVFFVNTYEQIVVAFPTDFSLSFVYFNPFWLPCCHRAVIQNMIR